MARDDFPPIPAGAQLPPGADDVAAEKENNSRRADTYAGGNKGHRGGGGSGGSGSGTTSNYGPDPNEPNYSADVWEYIHYGAAHGNIGQIDQQIRNGKIDAKASETKYTALHIAVKFGQPEAVRKLLRERARTESVDVLGQTPLALACCYDVGTDIPSQLLEAEANTEHVDKYSWTPLFWAARKGFYDVAQMLVDADANRNAKDKRGQRPYDVASDQRMKSLVN